MRTNQEMIEKLQEDLQNPEIVTNDEIKEMIELTIKALQRGLSIDLLIKLIELSQAGITYEDLEQFFIRERNKQASV